MVIHLQCVISFTADIAMLAGSTADKEIAAGKYRGPLHGIPYGLKDLICGTRNKNNLGSCNLQRPGN